MRRPYPNYRDSGVEWLGQVPEHWEVRRLKDIGGLVAGSAFPTALQGLDGEELPFFKVGDLKKTADGLSMTRSDHTISRKSAAAIKARVIPAGAIVYAKIGAALLLNRRRITTKPACIDNNMSAYIPDENRSILRWALYALSLIDFRIYVNPGAVPSLSEGDQSVLPILLPPLEEQQAIAEFLDRETGKIDKLVAKKRLLIERLAEYRTALITRTVTRGLPPEAARAAGFDPSPRLKPSGVEWLGDVPEHWDVCQLRRCFRIVNGGTPSSGRDDYWDGETVWLTPDDLGKNCGVWIGRSRRYITDDGVRNSSAQVSPSGSIILSTRAPIGHLAIASVPAATNQGCRSLVPHPGIDSSYAYYTLLSSRTVLQSHGKGSTFMELTSSDLGSYPILLPLLPEQQAIAEFLDCETGRIDKLSSVVETAIERLQEYRTALISAAVTGKIDVRDSVAAESRGGVAPMTRLSG